MVRGSTWGPLQMVVERVLQWLEGVPGTPYRWLYGESSSGYREYLGPLTAGCRESPPVVIGSTWGPLQLVVGRVLQWLEGVPGVP